MRPALLALCLSCAVSAAAAAQTRELPPNTGIRPHYDYYTLNAGYTGEPVLGWSDTRIEEKLGRGMVAVATGGGRVYLGWRLLEEDPADVAFNVYRSTAGGRAVRVNREPVRATTDLVDESAPLNRPNAWFVRPYRSIRLRDDIDLRSIHKLGVGDLDGNGEYDFDGDGRAEVALKTGEGDPRDENGFSLWDARTGDRVFGIGQETADNQLGSALVADIDPEHPGMELWADRFFFTARGEPISGEVPPQTGARR